MLYKALNGEVIENPDMIRGEVYHLRVDHHLMERLGILSYVRTLVDQMVAVF